jgi:hypothetical protein
MIFSPRITSFAVYAVAAFMLACTGTVRAACNNSKNWFELPGAETKVIVGFEQEIQIDLEGETDGSSDKAYPTPLPREMISKFGTGELSSEKTSNISFYESDGKGGWRVCRIERWWPGDAGRDEADRIARRQVTRRYVRRHPVLSRLSSSYMALFATLYFYDEKGRLARVSKGRFEDPDRPAVDTMCRRYDDKDRVTLAVVPRISKVCPKGEPDVRDGWRRYKYGEYNGETVPLIRQGHLGAADGSWSEKTSPFRLGPSPQAIWGNAEADSKNGVTLILGSNLGKLDDNAANTVVNSYGKWTGSSYTFTKPPVPLSVLENPDQIYQYDRRRQTYVDGVKLYEFFKANEHLSRHRYYMIDGDVVRHEQLDAKGKVSRVITIRDWRQSRPGPKPDVNDKLLSTFHFALLTHQVFHRVYEVNAAGVPNLVALSWNRETRLNPTKDVPIDFAHLVYGTPDGKERWKSEAEFERAFNTSSHAVHVFPDEQGKTQ